MTEPKSAPGFRKFELEPSQVEELTGAMAVRLIEYIVAALRRMNGEGHDDKKTEALLEKTLTPFIAHILENVGQRNALWLEVQLLDTLTGIYETYRSGYIETRRELVLVLKKTFAGWGHTLTQGQVAMMTPDRATISKQYGGPSQFAKFVLGRLDNVHWKTVHNWSKSVESSNRAEAENPTAGRPFGIVVTPREIREFIDKFADFEEKSATAMLQKVLEAKTTAIDAVVTAASDVLGRVQRGEDVDPEAAQARERSSTGAKAGPGRPPSEKG